MRARSLVVVCAGALLVACVACGGADGGKSGETSTPRATVTTEAVASPVSDALLDDVIGLAVQLGTMTQEQAVCVFALHPSIYREFLSESGFTSTGSADTRTIRQQLEDLKRKYVVQLGDCFIDRGGSTPAPSG